MTRTEDHLSHLLHAAAPPSAGVDLDAVEDLVRRRRTVRESVIAVASVVVVGTALAGVLTHALGSWPAQPPAAPTSSSTGPAPTAPDPSGSAMAGSVDLTGAIAWSDVAAPAYQPPDDPSAADTRPCTASDVTAAVGSSDGAGGHLLTVLSFTDTAATACVLTGFPDVTATEPGRPDVSATDGSWFPTPGSAAMQPGGQTQLGVETDSMCAAAPGGVATPDPYHHVDVRLPGGGTIGVDVPDGLDLTCGAALTPFYVGGPGDATDDPLGHLTVALELPDEVAAGSTLVYVADLTNPTAGAISLTRCPGYTQSTTGAATVSDSHALSCTAAGSSIAPGQTVRFEMRLAVPTDTSSGPLAVHWSLILPSAAVADATVQVRSTGAGAAVTGVLELAGGPMLADGSTQHRGLNGTVRFTDTASGRSYEAAAASDGSFRLTVPAGEYTVSGASPQYGTGGYDCRAGGTVSVPAAGLAGVTVSCVVP